MFGSKSNAESSNTPKNRSKTARENSKQKDNNEEDDGEVDNEQEYDPQFEPIVPLPDAIEIRTGEEDEEKGNTFSFPLIAIINREPNLHVRASFCDVSLLPRSFV